MKSEKSKRTALSNFIMKLCSMERFIEIKRQFLCDKDDFEPYSAFTRITRCQQTEITSENIQKYLEESFRETGTDSCSRFIQHYSPKFSTTMGYKEFLDLVLPKEHPELRAFITQRDCIELGQEEYFSYETEVALADLIELECNLFT